jgi:hypothetical protein
MKLLIYTEYIFNKDRTIVDLDIRESGIKFGKRSFMGCELTLFISEEIPVNTDIMKTLLTDITLKVTKEIFDKNKVFEFHRPYCNFKRVFILFLNTHTQTNKTNIYK